MLNWKKLTKKEAALAFEQWTDRPAHDCDGEYLRLRKDILSDFDAVRRQLRIKPEPGSTWGYGFDLRFAMLLYENLSKKYSFSQRLASDDGVWRYLSIRVLPDIVYLRWGLTPSRFYSEPRRVWLRALWWYIHLSWQGTVEETLRILEGNTTDDIVQVVERPGPHGYRIELTRTIMREYHRVKSMHSVEPRLLRKIMVLNTARLRVVEPSLCSGGEDAYVKELFRYFGYDEQRVAAGNRSVLGLRWPFVRISGGRV